MSIGLYQRLQEVLEQGREAVLVTAVAVHGLAAEIVGGKALVSSEGILDSVGLSDQLLKAVPVLACQGLNENKPQVIRHFPGGEEENLVWVEFFVEPVMPQPRLVVFGGGHISQPVIRLAKMTGFHVTVVDDRPSFANESRFPDADQIICLPFDQALQQVDVGPSTYVVIVTRGHRYDQMCLRGVIEKPAAYIGMIGSKRRVKGVMEQMLADGVAREAVERVFSPIGLKIGAETPEEIAVSIMAEIIAVRRGGKVLSPVQRSEQNG